MKKYFSNLMEVAVFLSFVAVLAGLLGRLHWFLDLASHFRVHAIVTMLIGGLLLQWLGRTKWARVGMAVGVLFAFWLLPLARRPPVDVISHETPLRVMTLNLLTYNRQYDRVVDVVNRYEPHIVAFIETTDEWIARLEQDLEENWQYRFLRPRADNFGIALFSKIPWSQCDVRSFSKAYDFDSIDARFDSIALRVIATHPLPPMNDRFWRDRDRVFSSIAKEVADESARTIVLGDLNCTPWSPCFGRFLSISKLRDSARGFGFCPTWSPRLPLIFGLPIDHVLVSGNVCVLNRFVGADVGSDHRPLVVDFK